MPVKHKMTLSGVDAFLEAIAAAGRDVDAAVERTLNSSANMVLADMKRRVPVDKGYLRDHLRKWGPGRVGNYHWVFVGLDMSDRENALHGVFVEYGTTKMEAQPYIRPAFDENKRAIRQAQIKSLKRFLGQ
jgi:HK97 gp10 family phage protein